MRKYGSRLISLRQYRFTDMFLLAVILIIFELVLHFAVKSFSDNMIYSPLVPMTLLVMMRWGWPSVFYAVGDGILFCALNQMGWQSYLIYGIGNAAIMLLLLVIKFAGKNAVTKTWYFTALFFIAGWAVVYFARAVVSACCGIGFVNALYGQLWEFFSLAVGLAMVLVFRRLDGMFEDQKQYLKRIHDERNELRRRDEFGDEPVDIDEQTMSILKKWDDGLS